MLYLLKRLKSQMQGGTREISKVAQTFSEIGEGGREGGRDRKERDGGRKGGRETGKREMEGGTEASPLGIDGSIHYPSLCSHSLSPTQTS